MTATIRTIDDAKREWTARVGIWQQAMTAWRQECEALAEGQEPPNQPAPPQMPDGWRRIAWIGDPEPEVDEYGRVDAKAEARRDIPLWYTSKPVWIKLFGPHEGLTGKYAFGKGANAEEGFIKIMSVDDASILLNHPEHGHRFADVSGDAQFFDHFYRDTDEMFHEHLVEVQAASLDEYQ